MQQLEDKDLSFDNLNRGAVIQEANEAIKKICANICDPNTKPKAKRKLVIEVEFTPNDDRDVAGVTFKVLPKLAAQTPLRSTVSIAQTKDGPVMTEFRSKQLDLEQEITKTQEAEKSKKKD